MIAKLRGRVDAIADGSAVIDVGGVGYLVFASARTLARLALGEAATLTIDTHVGEDHIRLYGFVENGERDWFRLLMGVQGVGAKVALAVLSALSPDDLIRAVAAQDKKMLSRANGVGPKLAARIVAELKDKAGAFALGAAAAASGPGAASGGFAGPTADAVSALVNLGYAPTDALGAVARAAEILGAAAPVEALIRAGLTELAPRVQERTR